MRKWSIWALIAVAVLGAGWLLAAYGCEIFYLFDQNACFGPLIEPDGVPRAPAGPP
jgi:hypothetical protein